MALAVHRKLTAEAFSRPNGPVLEVLPMKRILTFSLSMLSLIALGSVTPLSAQSLVVDKPTMTFSGQFGGSPVAQTLNVTSTGGSIPFLLAVPPGSQYAWLKINGSNTYSASTPSAVSVTADPTGLAAGTYQANITVIGGGGNGVAPIQVTFTVSAIGVNPSTVTLSYTVGSNIFPAPTSLTLSGISTACSATVATTSGGSWFSLLQNTCSSPGSLTVLSNSAVIAGLAPATYLGSITVTPTPANGSPSVVVPVTLVVVPTPPVTVNPASLSLNFQTGVSAPNPTQTFTVSTTSTQPLNYSFTASADSGNWISTITPPSGSISASSPATVTLTLNPTGLNVGTYTGHLTLNTPGGSPAQTNIPVTLVVSSTALLNIPTATLNFNYQLGTAAPAAQSVNITATSGTLAYSVSQSANSAWLNVPTAGSTVVPLSVSVNPAGLATGTYNATITISYATPGNPPQTIPVVFKITNDPTLTASVSQLSFAFQVGQTAPTAQTLQLSSPTGVSLNFTAALATASCGASWLQLNGGTVPITGVTNDTLAVSVNTVGVSPQTCSGSITINATNPATGLAAVNSPLTIPVSLFVSNSALLVLTPVTPPVFNVAVGAQSPAPQTINLNSTSSTVLNYTATFQANNGGSSWLFAGPLSGTTSSGNTLTINVNTPQLPAGTYTGTVSIVASGPGGATVANATALNPYVIPVTLNVTAGALTMSSTALTFNQTSGGPAPAAQTVTVGSTNQPLNFTVSSTTNVSVNWLSVAQASGNTSTSPTLTISADGSKLTPGVTYNGTVVVTSPGAGNSPATIAVTFIVAPGTISAPTTTLSFTQVVGGSAPAAQTIAVSGNPSSLNFTAGSSASAPWLSVTPGSGATPGLLQVQVNGAGLAVAQYSGSITIASAGASGSPIVVPVILNIVPAATLAASPTSMAFTYTIGQTIPPAQNLAVSATGTTLPVNFTTTVQFTGSAAWLVVTPNASVAPATLAVNVSPTTLAAGTYNGSITIASSNAVAPITVNVTLTVILIPKPVVTAVGNAANYSTGAVSPGENIVIFGTGVGPTPLAGGAVVSGAFGTTTGLTRVLFDNVPAPIIYASATQTSVMVPYGVSGRTTTSIVVEFSGVQSTALVYNVAPSAPGIYTLNQQGTGPGAILNQDGVTVNGPNTPEKRGNVIAVYMTGEGQTAPQGVDGVIIPALASALKSPLLGVTATIGGVPATVLYAGSAPGLVSGVMQVNLLIPATVASGSAVPVVITVGTASTQSGANAATVAVQ